MKKKIIIIISIMLVLLLTVSMLILYKNYSDKKTLDTIRKSYSKKIEVTTDTAIYKKSKDKYISIGKVSKGQIINLKDQKEISLKDKYFKIKDTNYYINYKDIKKSTSKEENKYKDYILYNENILTKKEFKVSGFTIKESNDLPILIKGDKYIVLFNNEYYPLDKKYVKDTIKKENTKETPIDKIPVLLFKDTSNIENTIKKINEENYTTLTTEEYLQWLNNNIRLSNKSVLLIFENKDIIEENKIKYNVIINEKTDNLNLTNTNKISNQTEDKGTINNYVVDDKTKDKFDKMLAGEEIKEEQKVEEEKEVKETTDPRYSTSIPVLNYHFFYDQKAGESCNERICLDTSKFEEQLKYLKDNNYKTLTMKEFRQWMDGEIEVPAKSVLLTIDDGAMGTSFINGNKLIPLLEKYDLHATLFLITAWWDINNYKSNNLDVQSHGYDIHKKGDCGTYNIKCLNQDGLRNDFKKSLDIVGDDTSFCYPFYVSSSDAISVLKELGFKLAFVGGNRNATRKSDHYLIPRYPIYKDITMEQFINKIK